MEHLSFDIRPELRPEIAYQAEPEPLASRAVGPLPEREEVDHLLLGACPATSYCSPGKGTGHSRSRYMPCGSCGHFTYPLIASSAKANEPPQSTTLARHAGPRHRAHTQERSIGDPPLLLGEVVDEVRAVRVVLEHVVVFDGLLN